ncbi:MAG: hypothetical protein K1X67_00595 [Fimbriimonadaceae bacterium]|nr:hypothetical protein [Fimbriimonadaceae bacterium]
MFVAFLVSLVDQTAADRYFESILAAHRKMPEGTIFATQDVVGDGARVHASYELAYRRPSALKVTMRSTGDGLVNRTMWANPSGITLYDADSKRYASTPWRKTLSLVDNVRNAGSGVDGMLVSFAEVGALKDTLDSIRQANSWQFKSGTVGLVGIGKGANGELTVTRMPNGRLSALEIRSGSNTITWKFTYGGPPGDLKTNLPKGAQRAVAAAVAENGPPTYVDSDARNLTEKALRAYDLVNQISYAVTDLEGVTRVWFDGDYVRQTDPNFDIVYRPGKFTLIDKATRQAFWGDVRFAKAQAALDAARIRWDPMLRDMLLERNPIRAMLSPKFKAKGVGTLSIGGKSCGLVKYEGPRIRLTLLIRKSDGLVMRTTSESLDQNGNVVNVADRTYSYLSYRKPIARTTFQVTAPIGFAKLGLDRLRASR